LLQKCPTTKSFLSAVRLHHFDVGLTRPAQVPEKPDSFWFGSPLAKDVPWLALPK